MNPPIQESPEFLLGEIFATVKRTEQDVKEIKSTLKTHDKRIRSLETTRSKGLAVVAVVCFAWTFLAETVKAKLGLS
jgi:hypothetical protein